MCGYGTLGWSEQDGQWTFFFFFFFLSPSVKKGWFWEIIHILYKENFKSFLHISIHQRIHHKNNFCSLKTKMATIILFPLSSRVISFTLNLGSLYEMLWPIEWGNKNVFLSLSFKGIYAFLSFSCYPSYHQDHFWANPMHDEGLWGDDLEAHSRVLSRPIRHQSTWNLLNLEGLKKAKLIWES